MFFGVLNVAVGAFVATSSEIASWDKEALVKFETARLENYTMHIQEFSAETGTDKSGMLSWEEFGLHLQNDKVKAYFQSHEFDVTQLRLLFRLPDVDDSNEVSFLESLLGASVIFLLPELLVPAGAGRTTAGSHLSTHLCSHLHNDLWLAQYDHPCYSHLWGEVQLSL